MCEEDESFADEGLILLSFCKCWCVGVTKVLLPIDGVEELLGKDHKQLDKLLGAVLAALEGENSVEAFETLDLFWARLAMHIRAENLHLFPSVLNKVKVEDGESQLEYLPSREAQKAIELHKSFTLEVQLVQIPKCPPPDRTRPGDGRRRVLGLTTRIFRPLTPLMTGHN